MSLEDVKVGDKVWRTRYLMGESQRDFIVVTRATPDRIYSDDLAWYRRARGEWRLAGEPYGSSSVLAGRLESIATPEQITAWEAEQAQQKAATEAAAREREQAREERRERMRALFEFLNGVHAGADCDDTAITFQHNGFKYRITEVEENQ